MATRQSHINGSIAPVRYVSCSHRCLIVVWAPNLGASSYSIDNGRCHDDVIKWKHFPRYWPFVRGIHRWPMDSPHKGQRRGALMFSLICAWTNGWANNRDAGDLGRHHAHYDVTEMVTIKSVCIITKLKRFPQNDCWPFVMETTGPRLNIKTVLSTYGDFHVKDKTAVRTSYL